MIQFCSMQVKTLKFKILLASKSPRREQIIRELGLNYEKILLDTEETYPKSLNHRQIAPFLAEKKSLSFTNKFCKNEILLTSDTIVINQGEVLEKPKDKQSAKEMLRKLSGHSHEVITGICLRDNSKKFVDSDCSTVYFNHISDSDIDYYINNFDPYDKAGSYGIQEWIGLSHIKRIDGSYSNIMGLPSHLIYEKLCEW